MVVGAQHVDVGTVLRVRLPGQPRLPVDQRARPRGREHPLVWVDDEGVGALDAGVALTHLGQQHRRQAVGAIHVEPCPQVGGDLGATGKIVDDAGIRAAAGSDHDGDVVAMTDGRPDGVAGEPAVGAGWHHQRLEAKDVQCIVDRCVRSIGHHHHALAGSLVAADGQRREVADAAPAHEAPGGARR